MKVLVLLCVVATAFARNQPKTCLDKPESGMCMAYFPSWYYEASSGTCKEFIYGGCNGNGNRYETEEECMNNCKGVKPEASAASLCALPAETGPCRAFIPSYHFDVATGTCKKFIYGGCGGNENRFPSKDVCEDKCGGAVGSAASICDLPAETGPCRASILSYHFDSASGTCKQFIYGGCDGNENRFASKEACEGECGRVQRLEGRPDCKKKGDTGPCRGYMPRFYYDQEEGMCKKFIYGGCGGNKNNFETEAECQNGCGALSTNPCEEEKVVGPCKAAVPRYFYNKNTGACEKFTYGGCHGNGNNFGRKEDCEGQCLRVQRLEGRPDCEKKGDTGPCRGYMPRFYYDQEEGMCKKFIYGGCGGNKNNFKTEAECQNGCGALSTNPCEEEKVVGPCKAAFPRYFYNKNTGACEKFIYGGCQGNGNNFGRQEDCEAQCLP